MTFTGDANIAIVPNAPTNYFSLNFDPRDGADPPYTIVNDTNNRQTISPGDILAYGSQIWQQSTAAGSLQINAVKLGFDDLTFNAATGSTSYISSDEMGRRQSFGFVGTFTKTGGGTLNIDTGSGQHTDVNVLGGTLNIYDGSSLGKANTGTLTIDNGATLGTVTSFATAKDTVIGSGGGRIAAGSGSTLTHDGVVSGSGALTISGDGTLALNGVNTYSGGTVITGGGTLAVGSDAAMGTQGLSMSNGTLRSTGSFSTSRDTALFPGSSAIETDAGTTLTHNGVISGLGTLVKFGDGTLVLNGANSFAGSTQIVAGTVQISDDANLGQAGALLGFHGGALRTTDSMTLTRQLAMTSGGGGALDVASGTTLTHNGLVSGSESLTKTGAGTLVLTGAANTHRGTAVSEGVLSIANDNQLGNVNYALTLDGGTLRNTSTFLDSSRDIVIGANGGTIETGNARYMRHSGEISGGILTKTGTDILELTGAANTHAGTVVTGGTLRINGDAQLGAAGAGLTLSGGTLLANSSFTMAHDVSVGPGSGIVSVSGAGNTVTQTADVTGSGNFAKSNTGTFVMAAGGTTALTGATTVGAGTLRVEGRNAGFDGGFVNNASGRTEIEGANVSFAQGATNNGTFVSNNSVVTFGAAFVNNGALITDPNTINFTDWTNNGTASVVAAAGDQFNVSGNLLGNTTNNTGWDTDEAILRFVAGDDDAHTLQLYGIDLGVSLTGLVDNFAWGTVALDAGQTVALQDVKADGNAGALYLDTILLADFATDIGDNVLDAIVGNGFNVYYNAYAAANDYLGGQTYNLVGGGQLIAYIGAGDPPPPPPTEVPTPAGLGLFGLGVLGLGWARRRRRA